MANIRVHCEDLGMLAAFMSGISYANSPSITILATHDYCVLLEDSDKIAYEVLILDHNGDLIYEASEEAVAMPERPMPLVLLTVGHGVVNTYSEGHVNVQQFYFKDYEGNHQRTLPHNFKDLAEFAGIPAGAVKQSDEE